MRDSASLKTLPDGELLRRLSHLIRESRRAEAEIVAHIGEVDARKLYARDAASSMFAWCTDILDLTEQEAYLRITVARASRRHPVLLDMLRDGRLQLRGIALLARHLTRENRREILNRAAGLSYRKLQELTAELEPKPDAPGRIRQLPARRATTAAVDEAGLCTCRVEARAVESSALGAAASARPSEAVSGGPSTLGAMVTSSGEVRSEGSSGGPRDRARVVPLAPSRHRVQFTASDELRGKLERLQALMRTTVPDGDLATLIELAVTEKLERLEATRFGKTKRPRNSPREGAPQGRQDPGDQEDRGDGRGVHRMPTSRHIPAAVRRAVHARDGGRCTYEDERGRRCPARDRLEFHHHGRPFGKGGEHSVENVRLMCRTHNQLLAEGDYGKEVMARHRRRGRWETSVSSPTMAPGGAGDARGDRVLPPP